MSVADQITRLNTAKADIKEAIEGFGVSVPSTDKIDTYAEKIGLGSKTYILIDIDKK